MSNDGGRVQLVAKYLIFGLNSACFIYKQSFSYSWEIDPKAMATHFCAKNINKCMAKDVLVYDKNDIQREQIGNAVLAISPYSKLGSWPSNSTKSYC